MHLRDYLPNITDRIVSFSNARTVSVGFFISHEGHVARRLIWEGELYMCCYDSMIHTLRVDRLTKQSFCRPVLGLGGNKRMRQRRHHQAISVTMRQLRE